MEVLHIQQQDGYQAFTRWWCPAQPRGAVLYLHGIQSHGGWYEGSGERLAEAGFAVLMPDRRGSGRNERQRGHIEGGPQTWLRDVEDLLSVVRERTGLHSVHIAGVSWGGKLAAAAAASGIKGIASMTLIAPGIYPRVDLPMSEKVKVAWSLLAEPQKRFELPLNDARMFTANPDRIAWVEADDLSLRDVTGTFLLASRRLDRVAQKMAESAWRGPVHVLLAEHDRIIDNGRTREWFERVKGCADGGKNTSTARHGPPRYLLKEYAGAHHTLEFEPDAPTIRRDVSEWLAALAPAITMPIEVKP